MSDYAKLAPLEVQIDSLDLERRELSVGPFLRVTTTIVVSGRGERGQGEDVTYDSTLHDDFPRPDLAGTWTVEELSLALERFGFDDYRRWAFESAVLDLALRQNDVTLGEAVGREYRPVRFVVSTREDVFRFLDAEPSLEFKVDPVGEWTREHMERLAATGKIRCVDLKGYYEDTPVDNPADPRLYRDAVDVFADAVVEDARFTEETRDILLGAADRLSFDAPIHSVESVHALEITPKWLNIKPSRFGPLRRLFDTLAYAGEAGIRLYGGGQFELGPGRSHIQALASLYYAENPSDVAPGVFNEGKLDGDLPTSPLPVREPRGLAF